MTAFDHFLLDPMSVLPIAWAAVVTTWLVIYWLLHRNDADLLRGSRRKLQQEVNLRNELRRDLVSLERRIDGYSNTLLNKKPEKRPATSKTFEEAGRKLQELPRELESVDD